MRAFSHLSLLLVGVALTLTGCKKETESAPVAGGGSASTQPAATGGGNGSSGNELIVASYDPTREMYAEFAPLFSKHWKDKSGKDVKVTMSHGPSGKQARDIAAGKEADVAAL